MTQHPDRKISPAAGAEYALAVYGIALGQEESRWFAQEMARTATAIDRAVRAERPLFDVRMHGFDDALRAGQNGK